MIDKFRLLVHESTGQKYEDLFVKIMGYADASFKPVKAHGNIGDRGNDGWCQHGGRYFQVYAPEDLPANNATSIKKLKDDFEKLVSYWNSISPIKEYFFVINDKYKGVSPHVYKAISELQKKHNLESANVFLAKDLESLFLNQNRSVVNSILNSNGLMGNKKSIYENLVDEITRIAYLKCWESISENLIANAIEADVIDGFSDVDMLIFKTVLPNEIPSFEASVHNLVHRCNALASHFTDSNLAYLSDDLRWWRRDMRWKKIWMNDQSEYHSKYELCDNWRKKLYTLHWNLVYALNVFSSEVRTHIYPEYLMGRQFTIVDSLGTYNGLIGYEALPDGYNEIN